MPSIKVLSSVLITKDQVKVKRRASGTRTLAREPIDWARTRRLVHNLGRHRLIQRDAPLLAIRQVGHMYRDCRLVSYLDRGIRLLARANAIKKINHVILIGA